MCLTLGIPEVGIVLLHPDGWSCRQLASMRICTLTPPSTMLDWITLAKYDHLIQLGVQITTDFPIENAVWNVVTLCNISSVMYPWLYQVIGPHTQVWWGSKSKGIVVWYGGWKISNAVFEMWRDVCMDGWIRHFSWRDSLIFQCFQHQKVFHNWQWQQLLVWLLIQIKLHIWSGFVITPSSIGYSLCCWYCLWSEWFVWHDWQLPHSLFLSESTKWKHSCWNFHCQ